MEQLNVLIDNGHEKYMVVNKEDRSTMMSIVVGGHCTGCLDNGDGKTDTLFFEQSAYIEDLDATDEEFEKWEAEQIAKYGEGIFDRFQLPEY